MISEHSTFHIPHSTFDNLMIWEQNLRALTAQAGQAAELGRWDLVEECYRLRGERLQDHPIPPALATALMQSDRAVETKIMNARSAVQSQLIETAKVRQNLLGLRSWQGLRGIEPTFMDRQA